MAELNKFLLFGSVAMARKKVTMVTKINKTESSTDLVILVTRAPRFQPLTKRSKVLRACGHADVVIIVLHALSHNSWLLIKGFNLVIILFIRILNKVVEQVSTLPLALADFKVMQKFQFWALKK